MLTAYVSNIQKFCVHDGPGIRTVVFLMGCPLRCKWCQNPENFQQKPVLMFNESLCIGCGECVLHCSRQPAVRKTAAFDRSACTGCGECAEYCYVEAKTLCGREMSVEQVYHEVMKDETFYAETGGGVTLSGGEATLYPDFCVALLKKLKASGVHTAVETCGYCGADVVEKLAPYTDLFLYDLKVASADIHKEWTGVGNERILENLCLLMEKDARVIIRVPLIPGVNDGEEFERIIAAVSRLKKIEELHILPFHQAGSSKYQQMGMGYEMVRVKECPPKTAEECAAAARSAGYAVNIGGWDCF